MSKAQTAKTKAKKGRPASIKAGRKEFDAAMKEALALHDLGQQLDQSRLSDELVAMGFSRAKGRFIVAQGFLRLMGAWEQLVEGLFLRFMTGATTPSKRPALTGAAESTLDTAFATILKQPGMKRTGYYTSWTKWDKVEKRALKYFVNGEPFASVLSPSGNDVIWYAVALAVRNRIAHPSDHAREQFIKAARQYKNVKTLRKGYATGEFLLEPAGSPFAKKHNGKTVFQATADSMADLADLLMV